MDNKAKSKNCNRLKITQIELLEESLIQYISEMMIYYMKTWTQLGICKYFFIVLQK